MNKAISGLYAITPELADTAGLLARTRAALAGGAPRLHNTATSPLTKICAASTPRRRVTVPVVAIGGITLDKASELIDAGANAVAVISALFVVPDVEAAGRKFCQLLQVNVA